MPESWCAARVAEARQWRDNPDRDLRQGRAHVNELLSQLDRPPVAEPEEGDGGIGALQSLAHYFHESGQSAAYSNVCAAAHNIGYCIDSGGDDRIAPTTGACPLCGILASGHHAN